MTFDELAAIRAHVARHGSLTWHDGEDLLAEVDRLTAQDVAVYWEAQEAKDYAYHRGEEDERARILAAMETLNTDGTFLVRAAVIAAIEGETT